MYVADVLEELDAVNSRETSPWISVCENLLAGMGSGSWFAYTSDDLKIFPFSRPHEIIPFLF